MREYSWVIHLARGPSWTFNAKVSMTKVCSPDWIVSVKIVTICSESPSCTYCAKRTASRQTTSRAAWKYCNWRTKWNRYKHPSNNFMELIPGFRQNCFSTEYFTSCIQALLLEDEKEKFQEIAEYLGRKK